MTRYRFLLPFTLLLFLVLGLPLTAQAQQESIAAQRRAAEAVDEGRYGEALSILQTIIASDSRNVDALLLRARAYEGRDEYGRAIADYQRVLEISPDHGDARTGLRRARERYNQTVRSDLESFRRLVTANPNNLQARLQYADALYEAAQYKDATAQYAAYLERTQGTPDVVRRYLISIANYEGDNDLGEQAAERYLRFYPSDDDLHMRLGYFRLWQGKYRQAAQAFTQSLTLNPGNAEAKEGLEQARSPKVAAGPSSYPIDELMRALERDPKQDDKRFELVDLLVQAGRYFEARQQLDALAPRHRERPEWQRRHILVDERLAKAGPGPRTGQPTVFVVDRLYAELKKQPGDHEKRFRLVGELLQYDRYYEAYDQLQILADEYDETKRWLELFKRADEGLIRTTGSSPLYAIDRLNYRLRLTPGDLDVRYQLVDELIAAGRVAEAFDILTVAPYADQQDRRYQERLAAVTVARERLLTARIAELQDRLRDRPNDVQALEELASVYMQARRSEDAIDLYRRLLDVAPQNTEIRFRFAEMLRQNALHEEALRQADILLRDAPGDPAFQRLYALSAIGAQRIDDRSETYLRNLLEANPRDAELLLDLAALRLAQGRPQDADNLLRQALTLGDEAYSARAETLGQLIERELIRTEEAAEFELLNEARRLAAAQRFTEAFDQYEAYFEASGVRSREVLKELAQTYTAAGDYVSAISILVALQEQLYEYDVAKEIAKNRFYLQDYSGAVQLLETLIAENPDDFEARLLLGDAYRELGRYGMARTSYAEAQRLAPESGLVDERLIILEASSTTGLAQSGEWAGYNYVGLIVPVAEIVLARGSGIEYDRWAQGIMTQVTLPIHSVLQAGITSHFLSGSRRLTPSAERVRERVNQVYAGGYVDLTPPLPIVSASYTNRISALAGIFDYEGGRTVGFGQVRYWRQEPNSYTASIGLRTTEGSIELWSPAGGEFNLRLTQIDLRAATGSILPDSLLRLSGVFAYNIVTDNYGSVATDVGTNYGTMIQLDASYRIIPYTYLGIEYYQLSYQTTTDIYFSPSDFETYSLWLEYERYAGNSWYFRLRGTIGLVSRSGFVSRRIESDLIYRLSRHFGVAFNASLGQSTRSLGNQAFTFQDQYNTFIFAGSILWTL